LVINGSPPEGSGVGFIEEEDKRQKAKDKSGNGSQIPPLKGVRGMYV